MRLNIANPKNGLQKMFDVENENILRIFYDKSISSVLDVSDLGDEWKNWILKINGGQDKEGFPMKQGIITNNRVRLLLPKGSIGCKGLKMKDGEKKRKSIRGSIVSPEISVLNLIVIKEGNSIDGLSRKNFAKKKILPKRASKIRKIFNLNKGDDLRKFINQNQNIYQNKSKKFPKIQRLITPLSIQKKKV
mmetsp:Transcript_50579/g.119684  ORF Transcript_50579/g.119684 Transcript_50579/m.119684 type:complete len:191 (-) Transcript_50579:1822-2394(-)